MKSRPILKRNSVNYYNFEDKALYKVGANKQISYFTFEFGFNVKGKWAISEMTLENLKKRTKLLSSIEEAQIFLPEAFK